MTSTILISSDLDSSSIFPGSFKSPTGPAYCSRNLNASHIIYNAYFLSSAIVINAITPDYKQSYSMKAVPFLVSRSNDIDCNLHIWKNCLYWIFVKPGWCKYLQYMKHLCSSNFLLCWTDVWLDFLDVLFPYLFGDFAYFYEEI
jgi:hypothetical protein